MANRILFASACVMLLAHVLALYCFSAPVILQYLYVIGSYTSVWNHGTTCRAALWSDRFVMLAGFVVDVWFIWGLKDYNTEGVVLVSVFVSLSLVCYAFAKSRRKTDGVWGDILHVYSHMFVCLSHFSLLLCYHNKECLQS